jgi:hypothetical protein
MTTRHEGTFRGLMYDPLPFGLSKQQWETIIPLGIISNASFIITNSVKAVVPVPPSLEEVVPRDEMNTVD